MKNIVHKVRMTYEVANEQTLSKDILNASLNELYKKNHEKYAFILNAGNDLKDAFVQPLCKGLGF